MQDVLVNGVPLDQYEITCFSHIRIMSQRTMGGAYFAHIRIMSHNSTGSFAQEETQEGGDTGGRMYMEGGSGCTWRENQGVHGHLGSVTWQAVQSAPATTYLLGRGWLVPSQLPS